MSKAYEGYKKLQEMKMKELEEYYLKYREIIHPFLMLKKEYEELEKKRLQALMNEAKELNKNK